MKNLKSQIKDLEDTIEIRKGLGKDTQQLEKWLKNWKGQLKKHPEWA